MIINNKLFVNGPLAAGLWVTLAVLLHYLESVENQQQNSTMQQAHHTYCEGVICHINFSYLSDVISHHTTVLDGEKFSADLQSTVLFIKNISNLMITGQENGSVIECSPESTFGFHMNNTSNMTLANLTVRKCGFAIPNHFLE